MAGNTLDGAIRDRHSSNAPAPLVLRINTLKTTREELKTDFERVGARTVETVYSTAGLEITSSPGIRTLPGYGQGRFIVQDEAAQLISLMLAPEPGDRVLDACAAPGGKTTHLAELMRDKGKIVALERDPSRMARIS